MTFLEQSPGLLGEHRGGALGLGWNADRHGTRLNTRGSYSVKFLKVEKMEKQRVSGVCPYRLCVCV